MDTARRHHVAQRPVNRALPRNARLAGEARGGHAHGKVALATAIMPGVAAVQIAVVDDGKAVGMQCGTQPRLDLCGDNTHLHPFARSQPSIGEQAHTPKDDAIPEPDPSPRRPGRLHGRVERPEPTRCDHPGCAAEGEFRAPLSNRAPGSEAGWQFLCLEHVRAFNARYNFFDGLSPDEIIEAQSPLAGWERATNGKAFTFGDAHDLFPHDKRAAAAPKRWAAFGDAQALGVLGLGDSATAGDVRRAYKRLVRRYHPDSNDGDRSQEGKLQAVVNAYTHLKNASAFQTES